MASDSTGSWTAGLHIGGGVSRTSVLAEGLLRRLDDREIQTVTPAFSWFRPGPGALEYFPAQDLVGIQDEQVPAGGGLDKVVAASLQAAGRDIAALTRVGLAVPAAASESERRHLLGRLSTPGAPLVLVDYSIAAVYALRQRGPASGAFAVLVAEDRALELVAASWTGDEVSVIAHDSCEELSGRALDHAMLGHVFARLPADVAGRVAAWRDDELSALLRKVMKVRSVLGSLPEFRLPVLPGGAAEAVVCLRQDDLRAFFDERRECLRARLEDLSRRAQQQGATIAYAVVIGDFAGFSSFTTVVEEILGSVEPAPLSLLADGAALAALVSPSSSQPPAPPAPLALTSLLKNRGTPLRVPETADTGETPEQQVQHFFTSIAGALARGERDRVVRLLTDVRRRAAEVLNTCGEAAAAPATPSAAARPAAARPVSREAQEAAYHLREAERHLTAHDPIAAVGSSHRAQHAAPHDHEVLLAMLDIHRRSATLLAGPENFEAALTQLRCALMHRQNDQATRQAMAARHLEQALFVESQGALDEARRLLEDALTYADDDSEIVAHLRRLDRG